MTDPIVIIGGGPTGMGAAWRLDALNRGGAALPFVLVEQQQALGGSSESVTTPEGFVFDITESGWKGAVKNVVASEA